MTTPDNTPELRPIPDFPGYFADAAGHVWSVLDRRRVTPYRLIPQSGHSGRLTVGLSRHGARRTLTVHRLVARAWLGSGNGLRVVRHLDGNHLNNAVSNLAWGTYAENSRDAWAHGTMTRRTGALNGAAKLTADQVRELRRERAQGFLLHELALRYGVALATVSRIVNRKAWVDVA